MRGRVQLRRVMTGIGPQGERLLRAAGLAYFSLFLGPRGQGRSFTAADWDAQWRQGAWEFLSAIEELPRYAVIAALVKSFSPPPTVLDLGCGHGELWTFLGGESVAAYHGIDIAAEAVARARARSEGQATFEMADLHAWQPPHAFDIIIFNEVLYYVPRPVAVVERYRGSLADGGLMILSMFRHRNAPLIWRDLARHFPLTELAEVKNRKGEVIDVKLIHGNAVTTRGTALD